MASNPAVYHGFWTNWSQGAVAGSTLTLSRQEGAYLIAFLALFVRLAGTHTWQITSYVFFRAKARPDRIEIYTQQELAILRNIPSDSRAAWEFGKINWNGRKSTRRPRGRPLVLLLTAAFHAVAFVFAGIFASRVTNAKSEVLLVPGVCGRWDYSNEDTNATLNLQDAKLEEYVQFRAYKGARVYSECYNGSTPLRESCDAYGRRLLDWNTTISSTCPFDPSMCINNTAVRMDSGYINSLYDLGINSHPDDAISFRKTLECAPIKTEGFSATYIAQNLTSDANATLSQLEHNLSGNEFYALFYGPSVLGTNATFISNNGTFDTLQYSSILPYRVDYSVAGELFYPIEQLHRSDATVTLLFLANDALYPSPVTDPWFNAQIPTGLRPATEILDISVAYGAQHPVSVLGCADQVEICYENRNTGSHCAAVNSIAQANFTAESVQIQLNERQVAILDRFYSTIQNGISYPVESGLDGGLLASTLSLGGYSPSLPDDQWISELEKWFATVLISVQLGVTEWVTGYEVAAYDQFKAPPPKDHEWMCDSQIVQRNEHASFSVLGLAIILCFGGLAGLINLLLPNVWPRLRHRNDLSRYRNELWKNMELLEMQNAIENGQSEHKQNKHESSSTMDSLRGKLMPLVTFKSRRSVSEASAELDDDRRSNMSTHQPLEVHQQQGDFPPQELARLISERSETTKALY